MPRQMTARQALVWEMYGRRMSFRAIGRELKIDESTVREAYQAARKYIDKSNLELPKNLGIAPDDLARVQEVEFAEARLRDYLEVFDRCMNKKSYYNAIQALNGSHKYYETIVKIQGVSAPERHEVSVTVEDLRRKLEVIEGEVGPITEAEVLEYRPRES